MVMDLPAVVSIVSICIEQPCDPFTNIIDDPIYLKISTNALLVWTTVNTTVTITMGPTHVHADKVLGFTVMDSDVMVS